MKRGGFQSLLVALALVLLQACASNITAVAPKSAPSPKCEEHEPVEEAPQELPFFLRGFSLLEGCQEPQVGCLIDSGGSVYGSGVLIEDNHVLTAGHCADAVKPDFFMCGETLYQVSDVKLHPYYKIGDTIYVDLAVLRLEKVCTETPSQLVSDGYTYIRGQELTTVGYGGGIKKKSNQGVFWYYGTLIEDPTVFKMLPLEGTVWFGDSGGAVYDEHGVLVGIISSIGIGKGHLYENSVVRLDLFLEWITQTVEAEKWN